MVIHMFMAHYSVNGNFCDHFQPFPAAREKDITILKLLVLSKNLEFSESLPFITKFPMFGKLLKQLSLKNTLFQLGPLTSKQLN